MFKNERSSLHKSNIRESLVLVLVLMWLQQLLLLWLVVQAIQRGTCNYSRLASTLLDLPPTCYLRRLLPLL
jgi:hypothetical protein